jgi:hypothetical protein
MMLSLTWMIDPSLFFLAFAGEYYPDIGVQRLCPQMKSNYTIGVR